MCLKSPLQKMTKLGLKPKPSVIQRSGAGSLETSSHLTLQFHFPCARTSRLLPDPSVSPLRHFPKSSTPNCLPVINQFPIVVPSQCHDFSYRTWQLHYFFPVFPLSNATLAKTTQLLYLKPKLMTMTISCRVLFSPPRITETFSISYCIWYTIC